MYTNFGASLGTVNLKTGKSKYFNIYETWGEDVTYEIYRIKKDNEPQYRIFATSGTSPLRKMGDRVSDIFLQGKTKTFNGVMVDYAVGSDLKNFAKKYGSRLIGYTYK